MLITERGEGEVFLALDTSKDDFVAMKNKANLKKTTTKNEISIFKSCTSDYIVKYIDAFQNGDETNVSVFSGLCDLQIIMEYCPYGSVASLLKDGIELEENQLSEIAACCLLGLEYLHGKKIIHRASY